MSSPLLILADDLTGAADCAAVCRKAGLPATIFLSPPEPPLPPGVVALTTDSRHLPPAEAAQRVSDVVARFAALPDMRWYKKIDSTLRGNIGTELDAMTTGLETHAQRRPVVMLCPAFPAQRRGMRNGSLMMEGVAAMNIIPDPVRKTAQLSAPNVPGQAPAVFLPDLLSAQSKDLQTALITLPIVRASRAKLMDIMRHVQTTDARVAIIDAMNESDLEEIVLALEEAAPHALYCGSAGLMGAWARRLARLQGKQVAPALPSLTGGTLAVIGSGSVMAQRQVAAASATAQTLLVEPDADPQRLAAAADPAAARWLLHLSPPAASTELDGPTARDLAQQLAEAALTVIQRVRPQRLILCGGDTALCVLKRLGVERLEVLAELQTGMPLTVGNDSAGGSWQVVLKAGNHGSERTLTELLSAKPG